MSEEVKDIQQQEPVQSQTSSYRSIFKATSLFGGVQVYQILIGIVKSKFIAVLLGPAGMGIQGLYQSAISLIQSISGLGLEQSAVRDVSEANASGDTHRVGRIVAVLRRLVWITGLLGMIATIALSPVLSKTSFGNYDYVVPFILLSTIILFQQLSSGQKVVLQGTRRLKYLAKSTAIGVTIGLIGSVPLYYLLGTKGIVPSLILSAITMLCLTWYFSHKVPIEKVKVSTKETFKEGGNMLRMGFAMTISGLFVAASSYILRGYIRREGGVDDVGLFVAGFTIMSQYTGMVFNAMSTDYYPRLVAINHDNRKMKEVINQQGEIALLILAPLLCVAIVFMPFVVRLLYSEQFLGANDYILLACVGMIFKAGAWCVSFSFIAKGAAILFIINETISNIYILVINLLGYHSLGLTGLGFSFSVGFLLYMLQVYIVSHRLYEFNYSKDFMKMFLIQLAMVTMCFLIVYLTNSILAYILGSVVIVACTVFSIRVLNQRTGVIEVVKSKLAKK